MHDTDRYLGELEREGRAFCAALGGDLDLPVPACPGWDLRTLGKHVNRVLETWVALVGLAGAPPGDPSRSPSPADDELAGRVAAALDTALDVLRTTPVDRRVWTFWGPGDVAFVRRRLAHELSIHRWDAEGAGGDASPLPAVLAADGIDEYLTLMARPPGEDTTGAAGTVHLHVTDEGVEGEWFVQPEAGRLLVTREHRKGDAALRGSASDLILVLWRRLPVDAVDVVGDPSAARHLIDGYEVD